MGLVGAFADVVGVRRSQLRVLRALADALWPSQPAPEGASAAEERFYATSGADLPSVPEQVGAGARSVWPRHAGCEPLASSRAAAETQRPAQPTERQ